MIKVIITGPECSGKTTLCDNLSKHFNAKKVDEYAREFLNKSNNNYKYNDLITIAKNQYKNENNDYIGKVMFCDTDLITIKIWSDYKYQKGDDWIILCGLGGFDLCSCLFSKYVDSLPTQNRCWTSISFPRPSYLFSNNRFLRVLTPSKGFFCIFNVPIIW